MTRVHIIGADAAARLAARSALERAGFAVSEAATTEPAPPARPRLIIVEPRTDIVAVCRCHPAVRILVMPGRFTHSQLLAAVRLTLARPLPASGAATTAPQRRSARQRHRRV